MNLRRRIARRLGFWADRLAPEDAFRKTSMGFEFITGKGLVMNQEGRGCPLWYQTPDYPKAHERQNQMDLEREERIQGMLEGLIEERPAASPFRRCDKGHIVWSPSGTCFVCAFGPDPW